MSWLDDVSDRFLDVRRGLGLRPRHPASVDPAGDHCKAWVACTYIEAQMASRDSLHSEATDCLNPELPPSPTGFTRELPQDPLPLGPIPRDAHLPDRYRDPSSCCYDLRGAHIRNYVAVMAPGLFDLLERPAPHVYVREGRSDHWVCPECDHTIWPYALGAEELSNLDEMGAFDDMVERNEESGDLQLDTSNPWRFLRYLDALAWSHMAGHLRMIGMRLTYPDPRSCRPQAVSWWLEPEQPNAATHRPDGGDFPAELQELCDVLNNVHEVGAEHNRDWYGVKMLRWATRGIHRASVHLTSLRRQARARRRDLMRDLFRARRGLRTVALALLSRRRMDEEEFLPWRLELAAQRDIAAEVKAWASDWILEESRIVHSD